MEVKYTPAQLKAVVSKGNNIIVSAGAGSGKTQVLSGRVTEFVEKEKYSLNHFLILTFTKLAAANMKERIRKVLSKSGLANADEVDTADIATFDAYALKIVKKYHNKLNVSPSLTNIDSNIIAVKERVMIQSIFEEYYAKNDPTFENLVSTLCFKDDDELCDFVLKIYRKAKNKIDTDDYLNHFIDNFYNETNLKEKIKEASTVLFQYIDTIKKEMDDDIKRNAGNKSFMLEMNAFHHATEDLFSQTTYDGLMEAYQRFLVLPIVKEIEARKHFKILNHYLDKIVILRTTKLKDSEAKAITFDKLVHTMPASEKLFLDFFNNIKPYAEILFEITRKLHAQIQAYKNQKQAFEFQDIAKMALKIVKEDEEVRNEIKDNLKMIMVDEYQDTSDIQDQFVFLIANNNVYMVGDVKQSIYRFRNADVDIFVKKYDDYKNKGLGTAIDLNKNFRSRKEVLDDINFIFKKIMSLKFGGADYYHEHVIEWGNENYSKGGKVNQNMHTEYLIHDHVNADATPTLEAELVARDIIKKVNEGYQVMDSYKDENGDDVYFTRPCRFSDFCIIDIRTKHFDQFALKFAEHKIPLYLEYDENIKESTIVMVMRSLFKLVKCLLNKENKSTELKQSFLSIARSFIYSVNDDELYQTCQNNTLFEHPVMKQLKDIVDQYQDYPLTDLMIKVLEEIHFRERIISLGDVERNQKCLDIFLDLFVQMGRLGYSIDEFILFLDTVDKSDDLKIVFSSGANSVDSVTIMDIHKSKGLEFKIIYYVDLSATFNRKGLSEKLKISDDFGLIMPLMANDDKADEESESEDESEEESDEDFSNKNILDIMYQNDEIEKDLSEKVRLFYVALTRAQEKMIFVLEDQDYALLMTKKNDDTYHSYTDEKDRYELEDYYALYIGGNINYTVFKRLCQNIGRSIPRKYERLENEKRRRLSFADFKALLDAEEALRNKLAGYIEEINQDSDKDKLSVLISKYLLTNKVNYEEFEFIAYLFGRIVTLKFKENYDNNTLFKGKKLKMCKTWFSDLNGEKYDPSNCFTYPYQNQLLECCKLCAYGFISYLSFNELLQAFQVSLQDEFAEFLKAVEAKRNKIEAAANESLNQDYDELNAMIENRISSTQPMDPSILIYINGKKDFYPAKEDQDDFIAKLSDYLERKLIQPETVLAIEELILNIPLLKGFYHIAYELSSDQCSYKIDDIIQAMNTFGIDTYDLLKKELTLLKEHKKSYREFLCIPNHKLFAPTFELVANALTAKKMTFETYLSKIFSLFLKEIIDLNELKLYASLANYDLDIDFKIMNRNDQLFMAESDYTKAFVYDMKQEEISTDILSFSGLIHLFDEECPFHKYVYDVETNAEPLLHPGSDIPEKKLKVVTFEVDNTIVNKVHPSKELQLSTSKKNLDLGTHLHECLEVFDFKHPDYSYIHDDSIKRLIERFLNHPLTAHIKEADIYPEYAYFDEEKNQNGIIDLMLIYPDYIQIIDYKTKNIDDEHYDTQLKNYADYIKKTFGKKVKIALYSIMTGESRSVDYE